MTVLVGVMLWILLSFALAPLLGAAMKERGLVPSPVPQSTRRGSTVAQEAPEVRLSA